jgi:hypothetical protein
MSGPAPDPPDYATYGSAFGAYFGHRGPSTTEKSEAIDRIDRAFLGELHSNARLSFRDLGCDLSVPQRDSARAEIVLLPNVAMGAASPFASAAKTRTDPVPRSAA